MLGRGSPPKGAGGFTLLEVLIALAILSIALLSLFGAQTQSLNNSSAAQRLTMGVLVARQEMGRFLLSGFPAVGEEEGEFGEAHPGFKWKREIKLPPEPLPGDMVREISLTIYWTEGGIERSYGLTSYAANLDAL